MSSNLKLCYSLLGVFFICGSIVNDAFLHPSYPSLTYAKLMFVVGATFLILGGVKRTVLRVEELALCLYSFLLVGFSLLFSVNGIDSRTISLSLSLIIGLISYYIVVRSRISYKYYLYCFLFWASFSVFIGVFQALFGTPFFTDRVFFSTIIPSMYRASGFMSDPNYFSLICLLALCFSFFLNSRYSLLLKVFFLLGVFLSGSRSGLLIVFVLGICFNIRNILVLKKMTYLFVLILLFLCVAFFLKDFLPSSVAMIFNPESYGSDAERNSLGDRMLAINAGIVAFLDRPIFGYGLGSLVNHPLNLHNQMSHNTFIEILAETGLIGLVLYVGAFVSILRLSRLYLKYVDVYFFDKILVSFFAFNIMSLTLVLYYSRILFFVFALMIVVSKGIKNEKSNVSC